MQGQIGKLTFWLLAGLAVGTAVGILYAPEAGKDMRRYLAKTAKKAVETGREVYETGCELLETTNEVVQAGVKAANA